MSEFYTIRRASIADLSALLGFVAGFLGSGYLAWTYLSVGFQTGELVRGFAYFLGITFGSGLAVGAAGLAIGSVAGWVWERGHRHARHAKGLEVPDVVLAAAATTSRMNTTSEQSRSTEAHSARAPETNVRLSEANLSADAFAELCRECSTPVRESDALSEVLSRTTNIAAWHGDKLVGVARTISDGKRYTALAEILVHPAYRRRGIARALMSRAAELSPTGFVSVSPPPELEVFFHRIGCERAREGFGLRRSPV